MTKKEIILNYLKEHEGQRVTSSEISKVIGCASCTVRGHIDSLMLLYSEIQKIDARGCNRGYIWKSESEKATSGPKHLDNKEERASHKDPTAKAVLDAMVPVSVTAGTVYYSYNNAAGREQIYLTIDEPFISCDGIEKVLVVPVFKHGVNDGVRIYTAQTGIEYYIYPYEVGSKPVKYLGKPMGSLLECDFVDVRNRIRNFIGFNTATKTVLKLTPAQAQAKVDVPTDKDRIIEIQKSVILDLTRAIISYTDAEKEVTMNDKRRIL